MVEFIFLDNLMKLNIYNSELYTIIERNIHCTCWSNNQHTQSAVKVSPLKLSNSVKLSIQKNPNFQKGQCAHDERKNIAWTEATYVREIRLTLFLYVWYPTEIRPGTETVKKFVACSGPRWHRSIKLTTVFKNSLPYFRKIRTDC